jgi:hypothetical protein
LSGEARWLAADPRLQRSAGPGLGRGGMGWNGPAGFAGTGTKVPGLVGRLALWRGVMAAALLQEWGEMRWIPHISGKE